MLFNSFSFLIFFAALVVVYYLVPHRFRWILLAVASLYFYATFNVNYVLLLVACTLVAYGAGRAVARTEKPVNRKLVLVTGAIVSLLPLFVFKYFNFFAASLGDLLTTAQVTQDPALPKLDWLLPAGLSFYTFSCLSYLFDVYQSKLPAERHLGRFTVYVSFFPKLLAGPIERATSFLPQLVKPVRFDPEQVTLGLQQMLWGLFKKMAIADRLGAFVDPVYLHPAFSSPVALIIASYFFAFQIYCDFSGYSDIAIGAARVLGFDLMENFRRAYLATSVPEFWGNRRWHISLSRWFRDYMYFPMGGSRVSKPRVYFNQMAVFVVSGLWHGANWTFVIWGGLNGVYQILTLATEGIRERLGRIIRVPNVIGSLFGAVVTFHLVTIAWVFFRAASIEDALAVFSRIAGSFQRLPTLLSSYAYTEDIITSAVLIGILVVIELLDEHRMFWEKLRVRPVYVRWAVYYALIFGLLILGKWGFKQFVYMQF
ncbi:MAG TPA: MBOAT family O-acyltransferase [Anaerolineae bacterium]